MQVICGSCFSHILRCSALQVPMFHKINIHKRPQNHITFFFSSFISPVSGSNPAILAICHPRRHPVLSGGINTREPSHSLSSGRKIRISDISDLTCRTICLAKGKYLSALKPAFFFFRCWSECWWVHSRYCAGSVCWMSHPDTSLVHPGHTQGASWVFCQMHLRQSCDTWEPGLQWKWGQQASDLWQPHLALSSSWQLNSNKGVCLHFDKPKCSPSVVLLRKTEIYELKDNVENVDFSGDWVS